MTPSGGPPLAGTAEKRCGGATRGVPQGVNPEWLRLHTQNREAGPAWDIPGRAPLTPQAVRQKNVKEPAAESNIEPTVIDALSSLPLRVRLARASLDIERA